MPCAANWPRPLPEGTLNDDMYLPLGAFFRGYRVIMDDSALAFDYPTPLASEFRRKVRTLAGVYQIVGFLSGAARARAIACGSTSFRTSSPAW